MSPDDIKELEFYRKYLKLLDEYLENIREELRVAIKDDAKFSLILENLHNNFAKKYNFEVGKVLTIK